MEKLKAAILQCDDVLDKFREEFGNYPEMVIEAFHLVEPEIEFDTFDVRSGCYPLELSAYDFYVITGSKASVYDDEEWIGRLVDFVSVLNNLSRHVFGICFGHQVMALAMGCEVQKASQGWGVGITRTSVTDEGLNLGLQSDHLNMIVSHQDQVMDIPDDSVLISRSDFCPYFFVKWSKFLISIQGHPEWEKNYSAALMNDRRDRIPVDVIEDGISSLSLPLENKTFMRVILDHIRR